MHSGGLFAQRCDALGAGPRMSPQIGQTHAYCNFSLHPQSPPWPKLREAPAASGLARICYNENRLETKFDLQYFKYVYTRQGHKKIIRDPLLSLNTAVSGSEGQGPVST